MNSQLQAVMERARAKSLAARAEDEKKQTGPKSQTAGETLSRELFKPVPSDEFLETHGIFKRFRGVTFESIAARGVPEQVLGQWQVASRYADRLKENIDRGRGLILAGAPGLMKTTLAVAILRRLLDTDARGSGDMLPMASLLDNLYTMRMRDREEAARYEERLRKADLLVLDDLGGENTAQSWVLAKVDSIITERYNRMLPVIVTTNLGKTDLNGTYGSRILDRLRSTSQFVLFQGASLRKTQ